jgi:hypothetical protein
MTCRCRARNRLRLRQLFDDSPSGHPDVRGKRARQSHSCAATRETLDDHFETGCLGQNGRIEAFVKIGSRIELMARRISIVANPGTGAVLVKTRDVERPLKQVSTATPQAMSP